MLKRGIIGIIAGIINGFFASGGGMILVPAFIYFFDLKETEARASSIFCILPMVITSGFFYYQNNYINWKAGLLCSIGGVVGGYVGAKLLKKIPDKFLKIAFTFFLSYVSIRFSFFT